MKKTIAIMIIAILSISLLAACGDTASSASLSDFNPNAVSSGTTLPPTSIAEGPATSEPALPEASAPESDVDTYPGSEANPRNFLDLPDYIEDGVREWYDFYYLDRLDAAPGTIVRTITTSKTEITLAVPELSDELRQIADERGLSCALFTNTDLATGGVLTETIFYTDRILIVGSYSTNTLYYCLRDQELGGAAFALATDVGFYANNFHGVYFDTGAVNYGESMLDFDSEHTITATSASASPEAMEFVKSGLEKFF